MAILLLQLASPVAWGADLEAPLDDEHVEQNICASGPTTQGIDVSGHDPNIAWDQVKSGGIGFSFIKATEGEDFVNNNFSLDWIKAKVSNVARSAYHFFIPKDDPIKQADFFLWAMGAAEMGDLAPMLDLEVTSNLPAKSIVANAKTWLDRVEAATGKTPIIYVSAAFWHALGSPAGFARYPLFIAEYKVKCPQVPAPWKNWTFWQYNDSGHIFGIGNPVDLDLMNGVFSATDVGN